MTGAVESWLSGLGLQNRQGIERLRALVQSAAPELTETIKWNAPSFADGDQDRVTLGVERKGGWRVVLHRGVATQDAAGFVFDDPRKTAKWPAKDRGVVTVADLPALEAQAADLEDLVRRWVAANRQA